MSASFFQCTCPAGYQGNGIGPYGCQPGSSGGGVAPSNACVPNPCVNGVCHTVAGSTAFSCVCNPGYTG